MGQTGNRKQDGTKKQQQPNLYVLLLLWLALPGCRSGPANTDTIQIDGSSTVYPLTEAVVEEYANQHTNQKITVGISGTGGGFQKFCRADIQLADASRPITPAERARCGQNKVRFLAVGIAYDGLAVVVNPANTWAASMTVAELRRLWEPSAQGRITRWSQIRRGWPDAEIHLFGPGVASGTYDYFTQVIVGKAHASRGDYTASENDNVLVQGVATDRLALGFFGLACVDENKTRLKVVAVNDGHYLDAVFGNGLVFSNRPPARFPDRYAMDTAFCRQTFRDFAPADGDVADDGYCDAGSDAGGGCHCGISARICFGSLPARDAADTRTLSRRADRCLRILCPDSCNAVFAATYSRSGGVQRAVGGHRDGHYDYAADFVPERRRADGRSRTVAAGILRSGG